MRICELIEQARLRRNAAIAPRPQSGFTIIELMIVLAVLGVLILMAITAYNDYTTRTKVLEAMLAASQCKTAVFDAYYYGQAPASGQWGCEVSGGSSTYVESVSVDPNGKVSVVVRGFNDDEIDGKTFTLTPVVDGAPAEFGSGRGKILQWRCGNTSDGTTIPGKFLPFTCRGSG